MRIHRKIIGVFLIAAMCIPLVSCGAGKTGAISVYSPEQIASIIIAAQTDIPELTSLVPGDELFDGYISGNYLLNAADYANGVVCYAFGVEASEITVLLLINAADMKKTTDALAAYKEQRVAALTGYVPEQADLVEQGVIVTHGAYAALLICGDTRGAESAFLSCFSDDPPKLPSNVFASPLLPGQSGAPESGGGRCDTGPDDITTDPGASEGATAADESGAGQPAVPGMPEAPTPDAAGLPDFSETGDEEEPSTAPPDAQGAAGEGQGEGQAPVAPTNEPGPPAVVPTPATAAPPAPTPAPSAEPPGLPPPIEDVYDPVSILASWKSGDTSSLTEKNKAILDNCIEVIREVIADQMTEYEKELAVHDWLVGWSSYDTEANNNSPTAKPSPDNDNPYGLFYHRKSICSGYTSSFQLFMDMLGIECITVNGFARNRRTDHAWNMVRLGGEWYCVDVTWDDPVASIQSDFVSHDYFNVTSRYMRDTQHIWDDNGVPEATATAFSYENMKRR